MKPDFLVLHNLPPQGAEFGKTKLRMKTKQAFRRLVAGYWVKYRLATADEFLYSEESLDKALAKVETPQ